MRAFLPARYHPDFLRSLTSSRTSQPAVTGHIRRLEASLEATLFIRSANGVSLTERGAHLRERVQEVFSELEQILRQLDGTQEVNGTLTLAASTTVARYFEGHDVTIIS